MNEVKKERFIDQEENALIIPKLNEEKVSKDNKLDELICETDFGYHQFMLALVLFIFRFAWGYSVSINSLVIPILDKQWKMNEFEKGFLAGALFLGYIIGAIIVGIISDRYGRKFAFTTGNIFALIFSILACFLKSPYQYAIVIMMLGIGVGISYPSSFALVSEISNCKVRANIMGLCGVMDPIGGIGGLYLARSYHTYDYYTRNWIILHEYRILFVNISFNF